MPSPPIAIVGRACVLPLAPTPAALWSNVVAGRSCLSRAPEGRWRLPREVALAEGGDARDRALSDVGGYVTGVDALDPTGFRLDAAHVAALDPVFRWTMHAAREALRSAKIGDGALGRAGLVMGNLSFPTSGMARFAEDVWRGLPASTHPHARFSSGMPALLTAEALGLGAGAFALDAACASSLYAIKIAIDRLHDGQADVMLAGAVNAADDLFLHVGFTALSALSPTGQSRPFHRDADGLVPAEGAAFVVLRRLDDALRDGDHVLGVIRGVGLSNDGRGRGLLAPAEEGQARALRQAYELAGIDPGDVTLLECHATGTPVGDATEVRSTAGVFAGARDLPVGSLKSNMGHLITVAGVAGLLKVLGAMDARVRPPTLHVDAPIDALAGTPLRPLAAAEPWTGPRRAGVSAFGFGGNNAHLVVEAWEDHHAPARSSRAAARAPVAIVGVGARVGDGERAADLTRALVTGERTSAPRAHVEVALEGLRFPPRDLAQALPQQLLALEAAREAAAGVALPRERTSVLVGMGCDPEVARYGARWRAPTWAPRGADDTWVQAARAAFVPVLEAAGVLGTMPNIVANRINSQLDLAGPSFSVSAEEGSGAVALELAARALRAEEIDAAVVGAVDLSHEAVHRAATRAQGGLDRPGDAAVALVLKRLDDARRDGDEVWAVLDDAALPDDALRLGPGELDVTRSLGRPHAAVDLLQITAAALSVRHGVRPRDEAGVAPWVGARSASVRTSRGAEIALSAGGDATPWLDGEAPRFFVYSGTDLDAAAGAMVAGRAGAEGLARVVIAASTDDELARRVEACRAWLARGGPRPEGVAYRAAPVGGELAAVFTGAAAAYPGAARDLSLALPELVTRLTRRCDEVPSMLGWMQGPPDAPPPHPLDQLWAASFVSQLHAELSRGVLGLRASAAIGYSSGETNSLFAYGAWRDLGAMIRETRSSELFRSVLTGECAAARAAWATAGVQGDGWQTFAVRATPEEARAALVGEPLARLTIINSPVDCVIAGEGAAVLRVVARLGAERAWSLGYDLIAHAPEIALVRDAWRALHRRATSPAPVRYYSGGRDGAYAPTDDDAADAITAQAVDTLDFVRVIERAWSDGVRVFVEHGPRGLCTSYIKKILGDRPHVAVALDQHGRGAVRQVTDAVAELVAAGVHVDTDALSSGLARGARPPTKGPTLRVAAHAPPPALPPLAREEPMQLMKRAPALPSVLEAVVVAPRAPGAPVPAVTPRTGAHLTSPVGAPSIAAAPVVAASSPSAPALPDALARISAYQRQLSALHAEFVASQAEVHARFLEMRARDERALLSLARGGPIASPPSLPSRAPASSTPLVAPPAPPVAPPAPVVTPVEGRVEPRTLVVAPPVAAAASAPRAVPSSTTLPGPKLGRADLEVLASGEISSVFGPKFRPQDGYARQVRMPEPPLLLADRVTGIDAEPLSMGTGTIWTETDVRNDSWYLDGAGRMPAGVMIESGQADLLLISWLGVDMLNRGERVYRLLGCELTYHAGLPGPGDTLAYDIHVDGHASQGDVRLFFFHYDCRVRGELRLSVRGGQAGFFTDEELADSAGVLWDAAAEAPKPAQVDPPEIECTRRALGRDEVRAFADGRPYDCFGPGWEATRAHVRSPAITGGRMLFLDEVTTLDPRGGPWGRGYLRAETPVSPSDWSFDGHFKGDPCMPGTLMFEGCLQAMALWLASQGYTIGRDGWRFEPVPGVPYSLRCRGQVTPSSRRLTYEVFVSEVIAGPVPTVFADLLCTVDGKKAFHARRVGLRLVPDFPLSRWRALGPPRQQETRAPLALAAQGGLVGYRDPEPVAIVDGFPFDYASLLACAWGPPSEAFGPFYARFDGHRRVARLPGPPYHFMSRVTRVDGPIGGMGRGTKTEIAYDVPVAAWYFDEVGAPTMPFCVLLEAALQPCGWLASYVGSATTSEVDLLFRNLDGTGTLHAEIAPGDVLRTRVVITSISASAGMIIESFEVECRVGERLVYDMKTVFGFFPKEAFEDQVGLPVSDADRARFEAPAPHAPISLDDPSSRFFTGAPRLPGPMLLMLDRVTLSSPDGGARGLGVYRADKRVDVGEWFFKAHFFQDPVQPGSLGIEALIQLLQFAMIERGLGAGVPDARFEPLMLGRPLTWKYRGQVVPKNELITSEIEITEIGEDERGPFAVADGSLWVDGKRIYSAKNLGVRVVRGEPRAPSPPPEETLDAEEDSWLGDHRPTWTVPALPMMSICDRLVAAAEASLGASVGELCDVSLSRWLALPGPTRVRAEAAPVDGDPGARRVSLLAWREAGDPSLSRFEVVATATARAGRPAEVAPWAPLADAAPVEDPYQAGHLFHGPAFRYLTSLSRGAEGASGTLSASAGAVPRGRLHQGLLDAATHVIPHDELWRWSAEAGDDTVAYPYRVARLSLHAPLPDAGDVRVEARLRGYDGPRHPVVELQLIHDGRVCVSLRLVEILLPKGPLGHAPALARRAFLRDRRAVPGVSLSTVDDAGTSLSEATVRELDWLPGTVAGAYGLRGDARLRVAEIAARDLVAARAHVHPSALDLSPDLSRAVAHVRPLCAYPLSIARGDDAVTVRLAGPPVQRLDRVRAYWDARFGVGPWPVEDLYYGLAARFVGDVVVTDPAATRAVAGRGCLYLANHQTAVESLMFSVLVSALSGTPTVTLAKAEHRTSWLGELIAHAFSYPGVVDPEVIRFFDRDDKESLVGIVAGLADELRVRNKGVMVHVEGTRALSCRAPVVKMSSLFLDLALSTGAPIVPVRFTGGLPVEPLRERTEFPVGYGKQDIWLGRPILPEELAGLPYKDRKQAVLAAMASVGPRDEEPSAGDPEFAARVEAWRRRTGASEPHAVLMQTLVDAATPTPGTRALVEAAKAGTLPTASTPESAWLRTLAERLGIGVQLC